MGNHWKRGVQILGLALAATLGNMLFAAPAAWANASGCNGDMCIEVVGNNHDTTSAKITYRGTANGRWVFGLRTSNGMYWSPPVGGGKGASYTWNNSSALFPAGQVCATIRYEGSEHGPPGYPCVTINYWS